MAAWSEAKKRRSSEGAYTIEGVGIKTSAITFGAAISKALTIASRLQREIRRQDEFLSLNIKMIGGDRLLGRVDVYPDLIETHVAVGVRTNS